VIYRRRGAAWRAILLAAMFDAAAARAQDADVPEAASPEPAASAAPDAEAEPDVEPAPWPVRLGGYVEAFWQWNARNPSNGITHYRGFDNRHNSFTLANVVAEAEWDYRGAVGRLALQVGHTGSTYYGSEPELPGAAGTNPSGADLWHFVQEARAGYRFDVGGGLTVDAGLFLSPIGPEDVPIRNHWNWSRSNLFFGLPFYHTGVRTTYAIDERWAVRLGGYNGWNSVVDNNREKSIAAQVTYADARLEASAVYFTGVERPTGAPEGRAWRHLLDVHATWHATPWLSVLGHVDGGFEPNAFGTSAWFATALYGRVQVHPQVFIATRGDIFYERVAGGRESGASPIFWPVPWVSSGTLTIDYRPHPQVSFRFEYRHDHAAGEIYFGGQVEGDGVNDPYVPNRRSQDTLTLGVTAWL
jgi:hypothetical protein